MNETKEAYVQKLNAKMDEWNEIKRKPAQYENHSPGYLPDTVSRRVYPR